ncbi:MAG: hypothetical protein RLZZ175_1075 [Bacteroidota bacterium]|jgi:hypothetical protein
MYKLSKQTEILYPEIFNKHKTLDRSNKYIIQVDNDILLGNSSLSESYNSIDNLELKNLFHFSKRCSLLTIISLPLGVFISIIIFIFQRYL